MKRKWQKLAIWAGISAASVAITIGLAQVRFFQQLHLKAQDAHFVARGRMPVKDIVIVGIDQKTLDSFPELYSFWHKYYADAMRAAADAGARLMILDVTFAIPVAKYEPDNDSYIAEAFNYASSKMPVICAYVPEAMGQQKNAAFAVPINMMAAATGTWSMANLTADSDDFVRKQELIEAPKEGTPTENLQRAMALRAAEKILGKDVEFRADGLYLASRRIPVAVDRMLTINYAGPPGTFPRIPLVDLVNAARSHETAKIENWVKGKILLLGPDNTADRYDTPFYTFFSGDKYTTPGVEIHANTLRTLLTGEFLQDVPQSVRVGALIVDAALCVVAISTLAVNQTILCGIAGIFLMLLMTHALFRTGWLLSSSEMLIAFLLSVAGGIVYRFATAEKKSVFFRGAVALFVGKQLATSLEESQVISLTGKRQMVTIMFTDIRGFTAFCESRDPAEVVDLLNVYMKTMVSHIVRYGGQVNKFIGDGILAVFSDDDDGAKAGDHAVRSVKCGADMVSEVVGEFKTGAGIHSGEVVIGNVGSSDKMEFTVLGDTVNLASRLESLNKEQKTKLLMSGTTHEMLRGEIDTFFIGTVPVRGKTEPMKLYSVLSLIPEERRMAAMAGASAEVRV